VLLRFEVSNHRSIMQPAELSLIAVDDDRPAARKFQLLSEKVLTLAGIYGPNASGKSNVLDALAWLAAAVGRSLRLWEFAIPREPFRFGSGPERESTFEIEMIVDEVRYTYNLVVDNTNVIFEGLYSYPLRVRRTLFERVGTSISVRRGLGSLAGTKELLTPTTLALSAARRADEPEVTEFARALAGIGVLGNRHRTFGRRLRTPINFYSQYNSTQEMFLDNARKSQPALFETDGQASERDSALAMLRLADLGIDDVEIVEELISDDLEGSPNRRRRTQLVHRSGDQRLAFDLADESDGTRTWYQIIGPVLWALRVGQLLLFDEIDASLHPRLTARLLELFQDPASNPRGAQLVFTTHDTSLLNHMNRDEVWLTEKTEGGATILKALAEYGGEKVRRSLNLERAYLQGRFGAVPELDQQIVRLVVGLSGRSL
jgi:predicted ATPase